MAVAPAITSVVWQGENLLVSWVPSTDPTVGGYVVDIASGGGPWRSGTWVTNPKDGAAVLTGVADTVSVAVRLRAITGSAPSPVVSVPPVAPPPLAFVKGLCAGGWERSGEFADLKSIGVPLVRLDTPSSILPWVENGQKVIYLQSGDVRGYNTGGVRAINVSAFVTAAVGVIKANPGMFAFEVLNEPAGSWFWGASAYSQANATAYVALLKALHEAVQGLPGKPLLLASGDGGNVSVGWLEMMLDADLDAGSYVDGFTAHPYDGAAATVPCVNFSRIEAIHRLSGKPVAVTEYGRPTNETTGDSPKTTETGQAEAVTQMIQRCRASGIVSMLTVYGYRDGTNAPGYGLVKLEDQKKPAWDALATA